MFLPTTLENTDKIVETIEELKVKIPSNPLEADILAMAEMIAEAEELDKASSDLCGRFGHDCVWAIIWDYVRFAGSRSWSICLDHSSPKPLKKEQGRASPQLLLRRYH